ncbi:pro-epidermal growth factor isoform X3 [Denticeps clupeoides]|uniref:EGF-like domain-containing protein n=1 Tax=Denticeps clupeoides TaxID=299321 RepID=A0AAY4CGH5_9TELE|nr:pro-epidermal growth factor isoform X3 [Denticeps clupeoides]
MILGTFAVALLACFAGAQGGPAQQKSCWGGHLWATGNWSCVAPDPFFIVGYGNAIFRMDMDGKNPRRVVTGTGTSILLDFHFKDGSIYWAEGHTGLISKVSMNGTQRQKLLSSEKGISGLAVDWTHNALYWTNREKGTIYRIDITGKNERIISKQLSKPSCITIDPNHRFLFWLSDGITPSIQRSDENGEMTTTLLKVPDRLETLSIDFSDKRLFWIQRAADQHTAVGSCDYNGNVINVFSQPLRSQTLKMSVFLDFVYITETAPRGIVRVNKYTGGPAEKMNHNPMSRRPREIRVVHPFNQPVVKISVPSSADVNECALWNHGCSLGCENIPGSYFCTCPHGYLLMPDMKTCQEARPCIENGTLCEHTCVHTQQGDVCLCPEGSVLHSDERLCIGCSSADRGGCSHKCITLGPGKWECECSSGYQLQPDGKNCTATGPPAYLLLANVVDIRLMNTDGTGSRKLLEESRGKIVALDYDPVENKVYFSSTAPGRVERVDLDGGSRELLVSAGLESPEGLAVDWVSRKLYWTDRGLSTIERSSLNGQNREVIMNKDIRKPRGIVIHPQAQKLFWTDMGGSPVVASADLAGGHRRVLARDGLLAPSGLALDYSPGRVYWCDQRRGTLESTNLDGTDRRKLTENQVGHPFDLTVFEDLLWVSDMEGHLLFKLHKTSGQTPQLLHTNSFQPAGLAVVHPLSKPGADLCLYKNGGCAQVCESRYGSARCSCYAHYVLSADDRECISANASMPKTESGGGESDDRLEKTLSNHSSPESVRETPQSAEDHTLFTEKMVSDQDDCYSLRCDVNAQCLVEQGDVACRCLQGFRGDGELCVDIDECTAGLADCVNPGSECMNTAGGYFCQCRPGFSGDSQHCSDIDECRLSLHDCDRMAQCLNIEGSYQCRCPVGYTGNGFTCQELNTGPPGWSTARPPRQTTAWRNRNSVESCPSSHESYCLHGSMCFYFTEMESYACNCVPGYMGERCQFSDLEWWELQQAEQQKRRNVAIAVCLVLLIALLSIAACLTYCYGSRRFKSKEPPADNVSDTSVVEDSITETIITSTQQFYVVLEHGGCADKKVLHVLGCQKRQVCPSFSSETGESVVSEEIGTLPRTNRGFEGESRAGVLNPPDNLIFLDEPRPSAPQIM